MPQSSGFVHICGCSGKSFVKGQETRIQESRYARVSKPVPGVHGKRGLERGWQKRLAEKVGRKGWQRVGERLAKGWRRAGEGLAKGWRRVSGFPCTLQSRNSRGARLETLVCDSMEDRERENESDIQTYQHELEETLFHEHQIVHLLGAQPILESYDVVITVIYKKGKEGECHIDKS